MNKSLENKQSILGDIRAALQQKAPIPYPNLELPDSFYQEEKDFRGNPPFLWLLEALKA